MAVTKETLESGNVGQYTVRNPHPDFGVDPNIINEYGHTTYPKYVDHPTEKDVVTVTQHIKGGADIVHSVKSDHPKRVIVNNEREERELLGDTAEVEQQPEITGWPNKGNKGRR